MSNAQETRILELERQLELAQLENAKLHKLLSKALDKIAELKHQLRFHDNENTPPSRRLKAEKRPPKGGTPGAKPGHDGSSLVLPEPDIVMDAKPDACGKCGSQKLRVKRTHQRIFVEFIPGTFRVVLCNVSECECGDCGEAVELKLPARGRFGEYAHSVVSYLRYEHNMPLNDIRELLKNLYGFETTEATLLAMSERTADEFEPVYEEIRESVRRASVAHGDETGWRMNGEKFWAWVFATQLAALFHIDKSRGKKVVDEQMKGFKGTMVTDDWKAYIGLKRQQCRAHIMRRAKRLVEDREYGAKPLREGLAQVYEKAASGDATVKGLLCGIDALCGKRGSREVRKFMKWLQSRKSQLFVFVADSRVPPDNNHAERLIRPVVLNRKITGGHRSERGTRSFSIMKSVMATMRLQGVDVLGGVCDYLAGRQAAGFLSPAPES